MIRSARPLWVSLGLFLALAVGHARAVVAAADPGPELRDLRTPPGVPDAAATTPDRLPLVVVLAPVHSVTARAAAAPEAWLARLAEGLERGGQAGPRARVRGRLLLGGGVLDGTDVVKARREILEAATTAGARAALIASVTRLAGAYSLELELIPVDPSLGTSYTALEAPDDVGLELALDRAANWARARLAAASERRPDPAADLPPVAGAAEPGLLSILADAEAGAEAAALLDKRQGGETVVSVEIEGNQRIEADAVLAGVSTSAGEPLSSEQIAGDVRRIYSLGFFRDVRVTTREVPGGVAVSFVVEENPVIRQVSVIGNDSVGGDEIKENLTLSVGSTIDYPLLLENKRRIEAIYASQGYHLAVVDYQVEPLGPGTVGITFDILEGDELRLTSIQFVGNRHFSESDLLSVMQTKPWRWYSIVTSYFDHSGRYAEPIFYQDLDRVVRKYMDAGFIRARVGEPDVTHEGRDLRVRVEIVEGDPYTVGEVGILGDDSMDASALEQLLALAPGQVFNRSTMTEDVERLRGYYADRGFYYASVTPRTQVDEATQVVDCDFEVEKGRLFFVEQIEVHGNTRTRDDVVRRELSLAEGDLYSADSLRRSRARVQRLGFFEEVALDTREHGTSNRVDVDIDVVERPTGAFSFGAGFGSTDGFVVTGSVRQDNLLGKGYQLSASLNLGANTHYSYIRFANPSLLGSVTSLSGTLSQNKVEYQDFDESILGFNVTVGYPLDEGETRAFLGYSYAAREAFTEDVNASSVVQREEYIPKNTTSMLSLSAVRDTRDDPRFPRSGYTTGFALEYAGLGGLNQFLRFEARTTWYFPMRRWLGFESTFVVNSRIGYALPMNTIASFDLPGCTTFPACDFPRVNPNRQPLTNIDTDIKLSLTERYFLGGVGAFQLRGFRQRSLGPRRSYLIPVPDLNTGDVVFFPFGCNPSGLPPVGRECNSLNDTEIDEFADLDLTDVIGGNKMFLINLELRFPLIEDMGLEGLVFLDMGNAFSENEIIDPTKFRLGTGGGIQWFSPFGPLLMQIGFPLDGLDVEDSSVFEFSMGGSQY